MDPAVALYAITKAAGTGMAAATPKALTAAACEN